MPDRVIPHFHTARRLFKSRTSVFVISMLFLFLSWVLLEIGVMSLQRFGFALWLVLHLAWLFLFSGMLIGLHVMALKSVDGASPTIGDLFGTLELGPAYLLGLCIYFLAVSMGLVLLIVPGIYLGVRYCLFAQIIADKRAPTLRALRDAAALARGNGSPLAGLLGFALLLNLIGTATFGVGLTISFPVSLLAIAGFYRSLQPATL